MDKAEIWDEEFDFDLDIPEIGFDSILNNDLKKQQTKRKSIITSDKYAKKAKQFLDKLQIKMDEKNNKAFYKIIFHTIKSIAIPKTNEVYRIRTQTQANLISIIFKIIAVRNIDELTIATYTINRKYFDMLLQLLEKGRIIKLNLLIASSYIFRDKEYYDFLKATCKKLFENYDIHLTFAWSHFKITLIKCNEDYYHLEGSMNYSQNNMAENLVFSNNKELYDFDYKFITEIMTKRNQKALEVIC